MAQKTVRLSIFAAGLVPTDSETEFKEAMCGARLFFFPEVSLYQVSVGILFFFF